MRTVGRIRSFLLILGAIATSVAGQAEVQPAPPGDNPAMYRGPDREQRLIEGARKEGQVTVYSSMIADQALRPILNGFEANIIWRAADLLGVSTRQRVEMRQQAAADRSFRVAG